MVKTSFKDEMRSAMAEARANSVGTKTTPKTRKSHVSSLELLAVNYETNKRIMKKALKAIRNLSKTARLGSINKDGQTVLTSGEGLADDVIIEIVSDADLKKLFESLKAVQKLSFEIVTRFAVEVDNVEGSGMARELTEREILVGKMGELVATPDYDKQLLKDYQKQLAALE